MGELYAIKNSPPRRTIHQRCPTKKPLSLKPSRSADLPARRQKASGSPGIRFTSGARLTRPSAKRWTKLRGERLTPFGQKLFDAVWTELIVPSLAHFADQTGRRLEWSATSKSIPIPSFPKCSKPKTQPSGRGSRPKSISASYRWWSGNFNQSSREWSRSLARIVKSLSASAKISQPKYLALTSSTSPRKPPRRNNA